MVRKVFMLVVLFLLAGGVGVGLLMWNLNQTNSEADTSELTKIVTADSGKWVGFAPFYLAVAKGYDLNHGVELRIEKVGTSEARRQMLSSGQVDFLTPTIDGALFAINAGIDAKIVAAYDTSYGGDGIISTNDMVTFDDLRGKKVAATKGFTNYFFLKYLMNRNGITDADIEIIDLPDDAIGPAFVAGEIDAGVMMEPWLSNLVTQGNGRLLVSSRDTPNVITDIVLARTDTIAQKGEALAGALRAWFEAVEYWKDNPAEANAIMAREYGMTAEEFALAIESVRWFDRTMNLDYFGTAQNNGLVFEVTQSVIDVAQQEEIVSAVITAAEVIDLSIQNHLR